MKKMTLVLLGIMLVYGNCKFETKEVIPEDISILPPVTDNGANTFGCLIDKVVWVNKGSSTSGVNIYNSTFVYSRQKDSTIIDIKGNMYTYDGKSDDNFSLGFSGKGIPKVGLTYVLEKDAKMRMEYYKRLNNSNVYVISKNPNPELNTITFTKVDTLSKIVSGRFEGKLVNSTSNNNTLNVSDGRFDIKFQKITPQ
jgi:hypothetical protein